MFSIFRCAKCSCERNTEQHRHHNIRHKTADGLRFVCSCVLFCVGGRLKSHRVAVVSLSHKCCTKGTKREASKIYTRQADTRRLKVVATTFRVWGWATRIYRSQKGARVFLYVCGLTPVAFPFVFFCGWCLRKDGHVRKIHSQTFASTYGNVLATYRLRRRRCLCRLYERALCKKGAL